MSNLYMKRAESEFCKGLSPSMLNLNSAKAFLPQCKKVPQLRLPPPEYQDSLMGRQISPSMIQSRYQRAEPQLRIPLVAKQEPVHPDLAGVSTNH